MNIKIGKNQIKIMEELFEVNPYDNFDDSGFNLDLVTWGTYKDLFRKLIDEINPNLIIEVGSWKGESAINMAKYLKEKKIDCKILCVDTWLGGLDHLQWKESKDPKKLWWYHTLRFKNGYPQLYYQFLYNVIYNKVQDVIIPFPNTSSIAARWLRLKKIKPDLIYIDGSHDEPDVYSDLINYYEILKEGGVMGGRSMPTWLWIRLERMGSWEDQADTHRMFASGWCLRRKTVVGASVADLASDSAARLARIGDLRRVRERR